jgi:serine protease Do
VGDFAIAVGNPLGKLGGTVTSGIISALEREVVIDRVTMTLLQTNAAINPGNSGGGLFNSSGELVGVVNAKAAGSDIEGLGFAVPIDIAKPVIEDILTYGYVTGRVHAGIQMLDVLDYATAFQYRVSKLGPYIYTVNKNSDAERAGLKAGDLITQINEKLVYESADVLAIFDDCEVGDILTVTVERNGQVLEVQMTFTEYKPNN